MRENSPLRTDDEADRAGKPVAAGAGSAYDLFLTHELVRAPASPAVVDVFVAEGLDVTAGVKQQLGADARRFPGHRFLPGHVMVIQQAMGVSKSRGEAARAALASIVEERKASGFMRDAPALHRIECASVAPAT